MSLNKRETLRKSGYFYYAKCRHLGKFLTVNHFESEGASRSTIFDIIKRFEPEKSAKHHAGDGGRPADFFNLKAK